MAGPGRRLRRATPAADRERSQALPTRRAHTVADERQEGTHGRPTSDALHQGLQHLAPLASGDVTADDIELTLARDTAGAVDRSSEDESLMVDEISFSKHLVKAPGLLLTFAETS